MHVHARVAGGDPDRHAARAAADVEHAGVGGDVDGVEQMPRAGVDPTMGKHAGPAHRLEQPLAVADHELAGEVADLAKLPRFFHHITHGLRLRARGRPHAHGLAGLGELFVEPGVARVVDGRDEPAADREVHERRLEDVSGELRLCVFRERHDGQIVGAGRQVGSADGCEPLGALAPLGAGETVLLQIEEPHRHGRISAFAGERDRRLAAARRRARDPRSGKAARDLERVGLGRSRGQRISWGPIRRHRRREYSTVTA